jgi:CRISPR-associated protein Cmr4
MNENSNIFYKKNYYCITIDPIHSGIGGSQIGMVNNPIIREPANDLPKILGSTLCGEARSYTAISSQGKYPNCAGKGGEEGESHCGLNGCPVCIPFGFSKGKSHRSFKGLAQFSDARILFFPVYSIIGPVWITSEGILKEFGINLDLRDKDKIKMKNPEKALKENDKSYLNLGWIRFELEDEGKIDINLEQFKDLKIDGKEPLEIKEILERVVLLSDKNFVHIVNDNLEVRTSVAIDPITGAAESRALFTYEAIPRGTVIWFTITYNNPELYLLPPLEKDGEKGAEPVKPSGKWKPNISPPLPSNKDSWVWIIECVEKGLSYYEHLGVGGMITRGMGRMKVLNLFEEKKNEKGS